MYNFIDSTENISSGSSLPGEALQFNGRYLENLIEGYRTLYVSGRELLAPELNTLELAKRHGSIYRNRRYPERVITVGFQLIAPSNEEFRERFNILNGILYAEEAQLVFADEPDKCFFGTLSDIDSPEPGKNAVTGEISFTCTDPFKYSVEELEAVPEEDQSQTILIDYKGTVEARPVLAVDFPKYGPDSNCTYLAFINGDGKIVQIGGVDTSTFVDEESDARNIIYEYFCAGIYEKLYCDDDVYCSDSLFCCISTDWISGGCTFDAGDEDITIAGLADVQVPGEQGRLEALSYGSGTEWHGPAVSAEVSNTVAGLTDVEMVFQNHLEASAIDEKGMFVATMNNITDNEESVIASLAFVKKEDAMSMDVLMTITDTVRKRITIPMPLPGGECRIAKDGNRIEFTACGKIYTFYDDSITDIGIHKIGILFGAYGDEPELAENNLEWLRLTNAPGKFSNIDEISADCSSASITMNGLLRPSLDVIGNQWESFVLKPGVNQIRVSYKMDSSNIPEFKVRYREVFL